MVAAEVIQLEGPGLIKFDFLWQRCGSKEGGRELFEELIQDLVALEHPDVATVEANPGDWGIDAYVGQLLEGTVAVWQAKYFIDGFGKSQQANVRESYNSAKKAANEHGYRLQAWTLAIPVALDGPNSQWWARWKKKAEKDDNVVIQLWHDVALRRRLIRAEAKDLREYYFGPIRVARRAESEDLTPVVRDLADPQKYEQALFVRQMKEAQLPDARSAKEEFFNAEILRQEVLDKGEEREVQALRTWTMALRSAWSHRYNDAFQTSTQQHLPGLFGAVMKAVHDYHPAVPRYLRAAPLHGCGLIHQEVDSGHAGWVRDWQDIARLHWQEAVEGCPGDIDSDEISINEVTQEVND